jgi:hypothetical protein
LEEIDTLKDEEEKWKKEKKEMEKEIRMWRAQYLELYRMMSNITTNILLNTREMESFLRKKEKLKLIDFEKENLFDTSEENSDGGESNGKESDRNDEVNIEENENELDENDMDLFSMME